MKFISLLAEQQKYEETFLNEEDLHKDLNFTVSDGYLKGIKDKKISPVRSPIK